MTDLRRLGEWLGELDGEMRLGGEVRARYFATGWEGVLRVETCDPPRRLVLLTRSEGEPDCVIELQLIDEGASTTLIVEDRGLPLDGIAAYGAGDQVLVEDLLAHLAGREMPDARARWQALHPGYQERADSLG